MRLLSPVLALFFFVGAPLTAQDDPAPEATSADFALSQLSIGNLQVAVLVDALPLLTQEKYRDTIRTAILEAKTPPRSELVAVLDHPTLAVRLAALDLLEEMAHTDFGLNPWSLASSPENQAALLRWKQWAKEPAETKKTDGIFSPEQRSTYLRDLLSDSSDKSLRANRMLASEGMPALGFLENYLSTNPQLTPGHRLKIRETQYLIVLQRSMGAQATNTARNLAFGTRDQLLAALTAIRTAGISAMPIVHEFLQHEDPLVRETANDTLLLLGREDAVKILTPLLLKEPDVNVIHGTLRRLKDIRGADAQRLVSQFLTHENEDILVSAIQTALIQSGSEGNTFFSSGSTKKSPADQAILDALADPRWRVKAAALEFVAKRSVKAAEKPSLALLDDPDSFVRFAAINALSTLKSKDALPRLKQLFRDDPSLAGTVLEAYSRYQLPPDEEMIKQLITYPAEARLAALRINGVGKLIAPQLVNDANLDVACAALRILASDSESITTPSAAAPVLAALHSGSMEKFAAIMDTLRLPRGQATIDPALLARIDQAWQGIDRRSLDPLYHAFLHPGEKHTPSAQEPPDAQAYPQLIEHLASYLQESHPPASRYQAALILATTEDSRGFDYLVKNYASLTPAMKAGITDRIYSTEGIGIKPLLQLMLRDPVAEIRQSAARLALDRESDFILPGLVFEEMSRPGSPLQPHEAYSYYFDSVCSEAPLRQKITAWIEAQLRATDATHTHIPALIAARSASNPTISELIVSYTRSPLPLIRRAAWNALGFTQPSAFAEKAAAIASDPDARVRGALTDRYLTNTENWKHHFTDVSIVDDNRSSYSDSTPKPTEEILTLLASIATGDPSAALRFEASLVLLTYGKPVDIDLCLAAIAQHPTPDDAKYTLTRWLDQNASRLTPAMGPLLRSIDTSRLSPSTQQTIRKKLAPTSEKQQLTSFESLIAREKTEAASGPATLAAAPEKPAEPVTRHSLDAVYFYKAGCKECEQARQYLDSLKKDFPLLRIEEHDILNPQGTVLNQALCARFGVPSLQQNLSPAVFTQTGFLVKEQITPSALGALFKETMETNQNDDWKKVSQEEVTVATQEVEARYDALSLPVVLIAGLLDGVNPCAFATIIFFLSYLQIARRTPREVLMVGIAFISAVFIAYFLAGLALYEFISYFMSRFPWLQKSLNVVFAILALIAAWLSFRDALRARAGRMDEMSLQLPSAFKDRIRTIIRTGAKARYFVVAAFVSGILISFLELACTGQVYAPIIYQIKSGNLNAVRWLALYNLAFVTPLIVIFLLAWSGMRSDALIAFQKKHTATVKFALALLFLALALFILFGQQILKQ